MSGRVSFDTTDYNAGLVAAARPAAFHLDVDVDDVERFFADDEHEATCTGWIDCDGLGERMDDRRGDASTCSSTPVGRGGARCATACFAARSRRAAGDARGVKDVEDDCVPRHVGRHDDAVHAPATPGWVDATSEDRRDRRWPPASCTSPPAASWR